MCVRSQCRGERCRGADGLRVPSTKPSIGHGGSDQGRRSPSSSASEDFLAPTLPQPLLPTRCSSHGKTLLCLYRHMGQTTVVHWRYRPQPVARKHRAQFFYTLCCFVDCKPGGCSIGDAKQTTGQNVGRGVVDRSRQGREPPAFIRMFYQQRGSTSSAAPLSASHQYC